MEAAGGGGREQATLRAFRMCPDRRSLRAPGAPLLRGLPGGRVQRRFRGDGGQGARGTRRPRRDGPGDAGTLDLYESYCSSDLEAYGSPDARERVKRVLSTDLPAAAKLAEARAEGCGAAGTR